MQQPTCRDVRIRSTGDAHKIFGAVQQGLLQMVTRRLDADERLALRSGCVYAWEERGPHSEITGLGIERFTEGRRWSPSRVRDEFLFYYEKYSPPADINHLGTSAERQPPRDWDPLVKQTYSVWVETDKGRRKWHLTAYFTQATIDRLGTIDTIPRIRDLIVPDGMFKSTRVSKSRNKTEEQRADSARVTSTVTRTYAAFPSPYQYQAQNGSPSMNPVLMHEPYQTNHPTEYHQPSPQTPTYPHPSPPPADGQYLSSPVPYSSSASASSSYPDPRYTSNDMGPLSPTQSAASTPYALPYQLPVMPPSVDTRMQPLPYNSNYLSPQPSPSSWSDSESFYSNVEQHIHDNITSPHPPPMPHYYSSSSSLNGVESNSPHTYPSPSPAFPPSYSLSSALTPLQPLSESRGPSLTPLQIPDRPTPGRYSQTPPDSAIAMEEDLSEDDEQWSLAPLNVLKRQIRYRREPQDEKTLRLLLPSQPTP